MDTLFSLICAHAHHAHWVLFGLLLLAGLSIPISADILILSAGALASTCIPDHLVQLFLWIFAGSCLAAWEAYWIGRLLGPKLYKIPVLARVITRDRLDTLRHYYAKWGLLTFMIGRFIPGGIRNALFISSGLTKMPFHLFIFRDTLAAFISGAVLFYIGYTFGENIEIITDYFYRYTEGILLAIVIILTSIYLWYKRKT